MSKLKEHFNNQLRQACSNGDLKIAKFYIEQGVATNQINNAISIASENGHLKIVKLLIEHGAKATGSPDSRKALKLACAKGHLEVVKLLVECGANIHINNDDCLRLIGTMPCSLEKQLNMIKYILSQASRIYWLSHPKEDVRMIYEKFSKGEYKSITYSSGMYDNLA